MFAPALQCGGKGQQLGLGNALGGQDVGDLRLAAGDGAGLIQRNDLGAASSFQRSGGLEQDAVLGTEAVADHDGDRRGQTQRTGAADDQHRDATGQCVAEFPAQQQPDDRGDHGDGDDGGHEEAGHGVGDLGDGSLGGGGIADHLDDLGQRGVLAHAGGLAPQEAGLVGGGGRDFVALGLVHRDALAGQSAFVHGAGTFQHDAVHGDVLTGADDENIAPAHFRDGDADLGTAPQQGGGLGGQLHQALECIGGLTLGAGLQHLAHGDEGQDHGGGLEVELHHIVHDQLLVAVHLRAGHGEEGVGAPDKAGRGAQRHQRIHIGGAVDQPLEAADEELLVDDHDDARQQQLNKAHGDVVAVEPVGERPAPHHVPHGKVHQNDEKDQRGDEPLFQLRGLVVGQCVKAGTGVRRSGSAAGSGAGTVARILYRLDDGGGAGGALHAHGVCQQTDRAACDAGNSVHGLFHPCRAGCAAHAGNIVLFHNRTPEDRLACPQEGHFISFGSNLISSSSFSSLPARRSSATQVRTCWASSSLEKPFSAEFTAATCTRMSAQ